MCSLHSIEQNTHFPKSINSGVQNISFARRFVGVVECVHTRRCFMSVPFVRIHFKVTIIICVHDWFNGNCHFGCRARECAKHATAPTTNNHSEWESIHFFRSRTLSFPITFLCANTYANRKEKDFACYLTIYVNNNTHTHTVFMNVHHRTNCSA